MCFQSLHCIKMISLQSGRSHLVTEINVQASRQNESNATGERHLCRITSLPGEFWKSFRKELKFDQVHEDDVR